MTEHTTHNFLYSLAVGVSAITAFLSPYLIRASNPAADWIDHHLPNASPERGLSL